MSRTATMTIGFLLVFIGFQLNFVETFVLTPSATKFWVERFEIPEQGFPSNPTAFNQNPYSPNYSANAYSYQAPQNGYRPFQNAGFSNTLAGPRLVQAKRITPATWVCWPLIFMGAVFVLHGVAVHRGP